MEAVTTKSERHPTGFGHDASVQKLQLANPNQEKMGSAVKGVSSMRTNAAQTKGDEL